MVLQYQCQARRCSEARRVESRTNNALQNVNAEFIGFLSLLLYFFGGTASIALLLNWALKRFGSPGQPSSRTVPASKEQDSRKAGEKQQAHNG
jgi:hypothetical protein